MKNYYDLLGVSKSATKDDIKKAFRKLAHQYHPDKKDGNADKFKEVNEAYSVLSDDSKRKQYDTFGTAGPGFGGAGDSGQGGPYGPGGFNNSGFSGTSGFNAQDFSGFEGFQDFDLGDIFGDLFGGAGGGRGGRNQQVQRGRDISIDLELAFEEAVFGIERKVLLTKSTQCDHCKGNGAEPGTEMKTCNTCNGKGKIHETKRSFLGSFSSVTTCPTCNGRGTTPKQSCKVCRGRGVVNKQQEIIIKVPAGINDGEMIRLTGQGEAIVGGTPGDLYVKIHVKRHNLYTKEGVNLLTDLNVKLTTALLGGEHILSTLDGNITVKIPESVAHGEILRIRGKGVPIDKSGKRGDILIRVHIQIPRRLSREEKRLVEELKKEGI